MIAMTMIPLSTLVPVEVCDGKDNNCDGQVDENLTQTCPDGKGTAVCQNGQWVGKDNDCDGKIDEDLTQSCSTACGSGTETCQNGKWVNCTAPQPQTETCDGIDNDCDGKVDEDLTQPCTSACGSGTETCQNGNWVNCTAPQPQTEICDGKDNDCNGQIDEGVKNTYYQDADADGYSNPSISVQACAAPAGSEILKFAEISQKEQCI
jgi:hypothetical protein